MTNTPLASTFAPTGKLRAAINIGNPLLAGQKPGSNEAYGVSVDLANELAKQLDLPLELKVFKVAKDSVNAVNTGDADFGFFAIDPVRGEHISFTQAYVLIEGFYLVRDDSPIRANDQVDNADHRVVVGKGSAYDLYLTRNLKNAEIIRVPSSQVVVSSFLEQNIEVAAGVKQQLESDIQSVPGVRLLDERFMVIQQAMGVAKSRGQVAADFLDGFVKNMINNGFVAQALARHSITGASVASKTKLK